MTEKLTPLEQRVQRLNAQEDVRYARINSDGHIVVKFEDPWTLATVVVDLTSLEAQARQAKFRFPSWWPLSK